ncbi:RHS repeat protein [Streptomyces sp. sk2.1]|nr:RHS repeat protein [Streptomyces sp. sk2.1]
MVWGGRFCAGRTARRVRLIAAALTAFLFAGLLSGPVVAAVELNLPKLKKTDPVPTALVEKRSSTKPDQTVKHSWEKPQVSWPRPGSVASAIPDQGSRKAGSLPVYLGRSTKAGDAGGRAANAEGLKSAPGPAGPDRVQVQVLDRRVAEGLGIEGVLLAVRPTEGAPGSVKVKLDYSGFRHAYGGDWASRLTMRTVPACALTTPEVKGCSVGGALSATNDIKAGSLAAEVALPAPAVSPGSADPGDDPVRGTSRRTTAIAAGTVLLAATAADSGPSGNFKATSLAPSASWAAGGSNGAFSWNYPIDVPEVPGRAAPDLKLGYSSQSIDGRTAATNNQANSIGDGWSMEPGYIERQYISCADDTADSNTTAKVGDLCWKTDNAVINLGGQTNTLVKDTASGEWHLESDDGTKITKLKNTALANGDNDGEHWQVTTPDGTRYYFGQNRPDGWAEGKDETNSTWTVPVFGNQTNEPCHTADFKDSWCRQAWRWNLDVVIDTHNDAMVYYWDKESNYYGRNVNPTTGASTATVYDRGGYLKRIEYGLRSNAIYSAKAAAKVDFTPSERCLSDCGTFDKEHAKNWPDVPFDRYCASGTECKDRYSPSFFSRKRLTTIATSVLTGGAYKPVDTWKLEHSFPATGDGSDPALWLTSITRTGHTGTGDVTLPAVNFKGLTLPNRVEGATTGGKPDPVPPMWRYRVYGIDTESGGSLGITYSQADCKAGSVPAPESNTRRCYPVKWSPPDAPGAEYEPYLDWFHSYVVTQILENPNTEGAVAKQTDYSYLDGMAWAKSKDDEFTKAKHLTYSDRKGYGRVQVRTGAAPDKRTLQEYRYFRGIDGASVKDHEGIAVTDKEPFAGMTRELAVYNGDGGKLESTTSYEPWLSAATATEKRPENLPDRKAYATGGKSEQHRTAVGAGWRTTRIERTFDPVGQVLTESALGDTAKSGDEECTTTTYVRNTAKNILNLVAETKTVAKPCGTAPTLPADLISTDRRYYDNATSLTAEPIKGDVTRLDEQDDKGTGYLTTATHTYDQHGREKSSTDALQKTTTTDYVPTTGEAPTSIKVTNPRGHVTTTTYDPARGVAVAEVDPNNKRTDAVYDGLGRLLKVWQPGWAKADHPDKPSAEYAYTISKTADNAVTTKTLKQNGDYRTTYSLYDRLLRERQTQAPATGTKNRIMTETMYDTRGWAWQTYAPYYADGLPEAKLATAAVNTIPAAAQNIYDGTGRITDTLSLKFGDEQWRTTTVYEGDRTTVIPPKGGTATTVVTDARGRTTDRLQYTDAARTNAQTTTYAYGKYDEPTGVTDPNGNTWRYTFDSRGQRTVVDDPDAGITRTEYDKLGRTTTVTDANKTTLTTEYDELGRRTKLKQGETTQASWTYDTLAKGQLTSSTRYVDGAEYTEATDTFDDRYQPTSTTVTIPSQAGDLAGTYTWTYGYKAETGALLWTLNPAVGNVPSERVITNYNSDDQPFRTSGQIGALVGNTLYDVFSRPTRLEYGATLGKKAYKSLVYDEHTGRLVQQTTDRDLAPQRVDDSTYAYDPAGNVTGVTTASGQDAQRSVDTQCFTTDPLGRLTEAWTAKADCDHTAGPTQDTVGGPDAYWQSYGYDKLGNRTSQTDHATTTAGTDVTTDYTHPAPGAKRPHAVQQAKVTGGPDNGRTTAFEYDDNGNTTKRTTGSATQELTWDPEGHLKSLTEAGKTSSYVYDADGNRLIAKNADGSSTLTLPQGNELTATANGTKTGTRYYTHNGETVAVRTGATTAYLISDHQGTALTAITVGTLALTRRKQLPFGQLRTTQSAAFGTRGFVGGTNDPTGLTHLGAREYDPALGRFLSVDPIIDTNDPAQMNAYSYAHNNPLTKSDPDGLRPDGPAGGASYNDDAWARDRGMDAGYVLKGSKWVWQQKPMKDPESQFLYAAYRQNTSGYLINDYYAKQRANKAAQYRAQAKLAEQRRKAEAERRKKDSIWGKIKGGFNKARDFVNDNPKFFGYLGVGLGVVSMITPLGPIAAGAFYLGAAIAVTTTADACARKNWNGCATGALSLGFAGMGVGAGAIAKGLFNEAKEVGKIKGAAFKGTGYMMRLARKGADAASVLATGIAINTPLLEPDRN